LLIHLFPRPHKSKPANFYQSLVLHGSDWE
jgi:hypothetical protein